MAKVTGFTAERMQQIVDTTVVGGFVDPNHNLILELRDGTQINAGYVKGDDATALLTLGPSGSVELSLTGLGTPGSPWGLSAEVASIPQTVAKTALLPANYRGGKTRLKIDGVLSSEEFGWMGAYDPSGSREVSIMKVGTTWLIVGQNEPEQVMIEYNDAKLTTYGDYQATPRFATKIRAVRLPSGLVVLSGLMSVRSGQSLAANEVFANIPPRFRPDYAAALAMEVADTSRSITITADGDMYVRSALAAGEYVSLDGIAYYAAGVASWAEIGTNGTSFASPFASDPALSTYGPPSYWVDPYGFLWGQGLIRITANVSTDNMPMINLPSNLRTSVQQHVRGMGSNTLGVFGMHPTNSITWKTNSPSTANSFVSFGSMTFATEEAYSNNYWRQPARFLNSWTNPAPESFPQVAYALREDGLRITKGLARYGTVNASVFSMDREEMWPKAQIILPAVALGGRGRVDITGWRGSDSFNVSDLIIASGNTNWTSLDQRYWVV